MRIIFENPRMLHFTPYHAVTSCKISEKYNGCPLRKVDADGRTHNGRNRVNSKVPIPTKVKGPKNPPGVVPPPSTPTVNAYVIRQISNKPFKKFGTKKTTNFLM